VRLLELLTGGKKLSPITVARITAASLARDPMTDATKALVSANSAKAELFNISLASGAPLADGSNHITLRTIPVVSDYVGCNEKTVRRALQSNGVIKRKWLIKRLGKVNS